MVRIQKGEIGKFGWPLSIKLLFIFGLAIPLLGDTRFVVPLVGDDVEYLHAGNAKASCFSCKMEGV